LRKYSVIILLCYSFQLMVEAQIKSDKFTLKSGLSDYQLHTNTNTSFGLKSNISEELYSLTKYHNKRIFYESHFFYLPARNLNFKTDTILSNQFYKSYIPPVVLMTGGLLTLRDEGFLNKVSIQKAVQNAFPPDFHTQADNYLQFVPIPIVYFMDLTGLKPEHDVIHRTILLGSSEILMEGIVQTLKYTTHELRPDGSDDHSFPSGHTAQAFLAATFLHKELGKRSIWFSIGAYSCATAVGFLRMANNRHYISDVLFGAGMGILSMNAVYDLDRLFCGRVKSIPDK
jgi:membrane-associated phospholipid phosphatase